MSKQICHSCESDNTQYALFSGGREYWCLECDSDGLYDDDSRPPRVQMLVDGKIDELRQEMNNHLDREA